MADELAPNPYGEAPKAAPVPVRAAPALAPAAPATGGTVHFFDEQGQLREANAADAPAIEAGGGRIATPEEAHAALLQQQHGGLGGALAATGEGAARGLSLGLSDPLAVGAARLFGGDKAADDVRQHLADEKEAHPGLSTAAELAGAAAPVLLSDGAAAGAEAGVIGGRTGAAALGEASEAGVISGIADGIRTLGVAPRGVNALGSMAEKAVAGVLGTGAESTLGRAVQGAAKAATRGIAEGGLFGAGQEISDSTLADTPLTAESVVSHVGHGALVGGALGFGLGAVGSLAADGASALLGRSGDTLQDAAHEQTWRWLDPSKAATKEAEARAGGASEVGRTVFDEVLKPLVEKDGLAAAAISPEEKLDLVRGAIDRKGRQIGELVEGNADANVSLGDLLKPIRDARAEWAGKVGGEDKVAAMDRLEQSVMRVLGPPEAGPAESLEERLSGYRPEDPEYQRIMAEGEPAVTHPDETMIPIGKAIEQRRALQQLAFQEAKSLDPKMRVQLLRDVAGSWNDLEEKALNAASGEGEGLAGTQLRGLNKDFQRLKIAEKALENNTARYQTNNMFSLGDKIAAASEFSGALAGGHGLLGAIGVPLVAAGHKALREHGNAYAAILLDRLATFGGVSEAAAESEQATDGALAKFLARGEAQEAGAAGRGRAAPIPAANDNSEARFAREEERVRQLSGLATGLLAAHLQQRTSGLSTHAPELAQAVQSTTTKGVQFLASKLPPSPLASAGTTLTPQLTQPQVSRADQAEFLRYVDAVNGGPPAILGRMARGKMTPQDAEVFRAVYPATYARTRTKVAEACASRKTPLRYMQRLQLGMLYDVPTDPTLAGPFVGAMQESFAAQNRAAAGEAAAAHTARGGHGKSSAPSFVASVAPMFGPGGG